MLVKPQFELQPGQVGKGGIVRDPALYAVVEQRLRDAAPRSACTCAAGSTARSPVATAIANSSFMPSMRTANQEPADAPSAQL